MHWFKNTNETLELFKGFYIAFTKRIWGQSLYTIIISLFVRVYCERFRFDSYKSLKYINQAIDITIIPCHFVLITHSSLKAFYKHFTSYYKG